MSSIYVINVEPAKSYHKAWQRKVEAAALPFHRRLITNEELPSFVAMLNTSVAGVNGAESVTLDKAFDGDYIHRTRFISARDYTIVCQPVIGWWDGGQITRED